MSFKEQLKTVASEIEARLNQVTDKSDGSARLKDAIRYSLLGGGKRLRGYLTAEFCELCGQNRNLVLDYAAGLEMIQAFSLIHDDLPAMDDDDIRRGKPSNHKAFGEATAILAGDALALDAFAVVGNNKKCGDSANAKAVAVLACKSGSSGMCSGQQIDMDSEGKAIDINELTRLVDNKTCALFSCACMLGCIGASADENKIAQAERFGLMIGRAFQIIDDLLDIHSTAEELGKTAGKDIRQEKSTFPALLGEDGAKKYAEECIAEAKKCLDIFGESESKARLLEFCDYNLQRSY